MRVLDSDSSSVCVWCNSRELPSQLASSAAASRAIRTRPIVFIQPMISSTRFAKMLAHSVASVACRATFNRTASSAVVLRRMVVTPRWRSSPTQCRVS